MIKRCLTILLVAASTAIAGGIAVAPVSAQSLPDTVEAIQKSRVSTRILFITAHPDDRWLCIDETTYTLGQKPA